MADLTLEQALACADDEFVVLPMHADAMQVLAAAVRAQQAKLATITHDLEVIARLDLLRQARTCETCAHRGDYGKVKNQPPDLTAGEFNRGE